MTDHDYTKGCGCRDCVLAYHKAYYQRNRKRIRAQQKLWRETRLDKDKERERLRRFREENADAVRDYQREYQRQLRKRDPERSRAFVRTSRARRKDAPGHVTAETIQRMLISQDGLCAYCECVLGDGYEVDHMLPIVRGGSNHWDNLAITCRRCNRRKSKKTVEEFFNGKEQA